jgi:cell division protease FtsH
MRKRQRKPPDAAGLGGAPARPKQDAEAAQRRRRNLVRALAVMVVVLFALNYWAGSRATRAPARLLVPYSPFFLAQVRAGNVDSITSIGSAIQGRFRHAERYGGSGPTVRFETLIPAFANTNALSALLERNDVTVNAQPLDRGAPWWKTLLIGFGPTLLFLGLLLLLLRRAGSGGMLHAFGRARARRYEATEGQVTFADVAGIDEAKQELTEVVDFLRRPDKYLRLGARIPRGVLLSGPPGTGKTLLARAVAGEAGAPFFSMSASEFVEAIVGIGASRVRDLFKQAKEAAPAIVFIDELDAVGRSRGSGAGGGFGGGNDEREQTLNQILTEMDGFDASTGVIVIGATNRPDVLDKALLRPGRFDRRVAVQAPDRAGREEVLLVHTRGVPLDNAVDLGRIASTTPGMVGAELANLVNEAALLAARRDHEAVGVDDFADALERIILGAERRIMMTHEDRRRTAYHEAGHALVGMLTPGADPVRKISIILRGLALGVTFSAPDADRYNYTRDELTAKIKVALGGRGAEQIVYGEATTGAEGDIRQLTELARAMAGRWGMSEAIGPLAVLSADGRASFIPAAVDASPQTQHVVDEEARKIVEQAEREVLRLLSENRGKLDALADALLEQETLDEDAAYLAASVHREPSPHDPDGVPAEPLAAG